MREVAGDTDSYSGTWPLNDKAKIERKQRNKPSLSISIPSRYTGHCNLHLEVFMHVPTCVLHR